MRKKIIYWLPSLVLMYLIFLGSADPLSGQKSDFVTELIISLVAYFTGYHFTLIEQESTSFIIRKSAHITEYFLLSLSYYYSLTRTINLTKTFRKSYLIVSLMALLFSITDEYHQTFVNNRVGTHNDVLIDSIGICLAYLVIYYKKYKLKAYK
jgi:VanZ family protein